MKRKNISKIKLDPEEKELLNSVERGEWKPVKNSKEEATFAKEAAENFLRKDTKNPSSSFK